MTGDLQVPLKVLGENSPRFESIRRRTQLQLPDRLLTIVAHDLQSGPGVSVTPEDLHDFALKLGEHVRVMRARPE